MTRPSCLVAVTGTGTEIGKTWVAAALASSLRSRGVRVAARKPAQSFAPTDVTTDAHRLAAATGEDPAVVSPRHRWYEVPMAPPMAAAALGRPRFMVADLLREVTASWPTPACQVGLVEGAGGVAAPQAGDGDMADLISGLDADLVILVADPALGALNLVRLSRAALDGHRVVVHLNRWAADDDLHCRNRTWLVERDGTEVTVSIDALTERVADHLAGPGTLP